MCTPQRLVWAALACCLSYNLVPTDLTAQPPRYRPQYRPDYHRDYHRPSYPVARPQTKSYDQYITPREQYVPYQNTVPSVYYVGIPSSQFNEVFAEQQNSQWCWAAAIQMILQYYGVDVSQRDIVYRTYGSDNVGRLPNRPASFETITDNLNTLAIDRDGEQYVIRASVGYGIPDPATLVDELRNERPVLIGYQTGPYTGHAVVATAVSFLGSLDYPRLQTIVVRDPRRTGDRYYGERSAVPGRAEYDASMLRAINVYWYVRVYRIGERQG